MYKKIDKYGVWYYFFLHSFVILAINHCEISEQNIFEKILEIENEKPQNEFFVLK